MPAGSYYPLNMTTFPLHAVPPLNLVQILGKMGYREASRMRRTCHDMDELIDRNRKLFKFPVERVTFMFKLSETETKEMVWEQSFEMNFPECPTLCRFSPYHGIPDNALFDSISIVCHNPTSIASFTGKPLLEYIAKTNIRCRQLNCMKKLANQIDLVKLYKACKASTVFVTNSRYRISHADKPIALQLDIVGQLAKLKCPVLVIELCEELPYEYAEILSQFQIINIARIENRRSQTLAPLLKLMMSDRVFPLKSFLLPVYSGYLSKDEISELQMRKWRLKQARHVLPATFLINSPNYYILLMAHGKRRKHWCGHRIPKSDIDLLVSKWISHYYHLPSDVSTLYEYIRNNPDNYDGIKEQMETLLNSSYSTTAPDVRLYYMC